MRIVRRRSRGGAGASIPRPPRARIDLNAGVSVWFGSFRFRLRRLWTRHCRRAARGARLPARPSGLCPRCSSFLVRKHARIAHRRDAPTFRPSPTRGGDDAPIARPSVGTVLACPFARESPAAAPAPPRASPRDASPRLALPTFSIGARDGSRASRHSPDATGQSDSSRARTAARPRPARAAPPASRLPRASAIHAPQDPTPLTPLLPLGPSPPTPSDPQIRRSSYHNVVRVRDVCRMMDVSGIQTYVINSARVVFLSERPHPRGKGGSASGRGAARARACRHCHRTLQADASDFCSISCKVSSGANMAPSEEAAAAAVEEPANPKPSAASTSATKGAKGAKTPKEEPAEKRRTGARGADKSSRGSPRTPSDASRLRTTSANDASPSPETEGGEGGTGGEETPTPSRRGAKRAPPSGVKREPATPATRRAGSGSSAKRAKTSADGDGDGDGNNTGGDGSFAVVTPPTFAPKLVLVSNSRRKNRPKRSPDA